MYACIYELWKNCCGRDGTGRVGKSKVLQEVLADLKSKGINCGTEIYAVEQKYMLWSRGIYCGAEINIVEQSRGNYCIAEVHIHIVEQQIVEHLWFM